MLQPIAADAPCGEDLSSDPAYLALDHSARGTPARHDFKTGAELAPEEPDWLTIRQQCTQMLLRSKDLELALLYTKASVRLEGVAGLRDGLVLMRGLLERYWETLYPRLDPEDGNNPVERLNIVGSLSAGPDPMNPRDPTNLRQCLLEAPLCGPPRGPRYALRDLLLAQRAPAAPAAPAETQDQAPPAPQMSDIDSAFQDTDAQAMLNLDKAAEASLEHLAAIGETFAQRAGSDKVPSLAELTDILQSIRRQLQRQLVRRGLASSPEAPPDGDGQGKAPRPAEAGSGEIRSAQDVVRILERVCSYYQQHEPSSPVPLLLRGAQRMVGKSFGEIARTLNCHTMDAIKTLESISGLDNDAADR